MMAFGDIPKLCFAFIVSATTYILPGPDIQTTAITVFCFVCLDTASGIVASFVSKGKRRRQFKSRKLSRVLVKLFGYSLVVVIASIVAAEVMPSAPQAREVLIRFVLWAALLTEAKSILENVQKMGVTVPPWLLKLIKDRATQIANQATVTPADDEQPESEE